MNIGYKDYKYWLYKFKTLVIQIKMTTMVTTVPSTFSNKDAHGKFNALSTQSTFFQ